MIIKDIVWIGLNTLILKNCIIWKGSIIAAGGILIKHIEPYSVVGWVPAKLFKKTK